MTDRPTQVTDESRKLRAIVVNMLDGANAHLPFADIVRDVPPAMRGRRHAGAPHTLWQVLEHLRITLWDILEFSRDTKHVSPEFPKGYWPEGDAPPDPAAWDRTIAEFEADLAALQGLVSDPGQDLFARLAHPDAKPHHTLLREALVVVDHNAYHLGEIVLLRRLLGVWPEDK